jgi:PPOX class probable F420-dependent enzyme
MGDLDGVRRIGSASGFLAIVATTRPDGSVHASLVNAGPLEDPVTGEAGVAMVIVGGARKLDHLRRTGQATVVFRDGWSWVSVDGRVRLLGPDDDHESVDLPSVLRAVFKSAGGTHDDWDEYDRVMKSERRTAVFVHADRILGTA